MTNTTFNNIRNDMTEILQDIESDIRLAKFPLIQMARGEAEENATALLNSLETLKNSLEDRIEDIEKVLN